jgi:hypothetical protein
LGLLVLKKFKNIEPAIICSSAFLVNMGVPFEEFGEEESEIKNGFVPISSFLMIYFLRELEALRCSVLDLF